MVFKIKGSLMYLFIAYTLNFNLNVSFVTSQGLARYDKKGKLLLITYFCRSCYKPFETKIRQIYELK